MISYFQFSYLHLKKLLSAWILILTLLLFSGCNQKAAEKNLTIKGHAMGTTWQVTLARCPVDTDKEEINNEIKAILEQIESQMSHWREGSILTQFNDTRSTKPIDIPQEMAEVIQHALNVQKQTNGAFNITVAPLVNLWGFGPQLRRTEVPENEQIDRLLKLAGKNQLTLSKPDTGVFTLKKNNPDLKIDLSALAKGYAIDKIAEYLSNDWNLNHHLVELGGELRATGLNAKQQTWKVGLEQPDSNRIGTIRRTISLSNQAVATSGNYRIFFQNHKTKQTYSHIIDPRTGRPINHDLVSVSVISNSAMGADAMATALMVMGPKLGFEFATKNKIAATFVSLTASGLKEKSTSNFSTE